MTGKPDLYENHNFDSKSSKKALGQPPSMACGMVSSIMELPSSSSDVLMTSKVSWPLSLSFRFAGSGGCDDVVETEGWPRSCCDGLGRVYSRPKHHTGNLELSSLTGSGSQKYCTIRLTLAMAGSPGQKL